MIVSLINEAIVSYQRLSVTNICVRTFPPRVIKPFKKIAHKITPNIEGGVNSNVCDVKKVERKLGTVVARVNDET